MFTLDKSANASSLLNFMREQVNALSYLTATPTPQPRGLN